MNLLQPMLRKMLLYQR